MGEHNEQHNGEHNWQIELTGESWTVVGADGTVHRVSVPEWSLGRMPVLFASVLGRPVAEHHILAAHGEGLFAGLSGPIDSWVPRVAALLCRLDRLRTIVDAWPAGHQMMSRTELRERAWNDDTVAALIRPAAELPNPHNAGGGAMVLFDTRRVLALERTAEWFRRSARLRHRRAFAGHDPAAPRKVRAAALEIAAVHPQGRGRQLAEIAVLDASPAVRVLVTQGLQRFWAGRTWRPVDLDDADVGPVAALLGGPGVTAAALVHRDPLVARIATGRMLVALAS